MIIRSRGGDWIPGLLGRVTHYTVFEPAHFIMERKMLLEIKQRAEARAQRHADALASSVS